MKIQNLTFKDVADFVNGKAFKPSEWSNKGTPIIRIQNLNDSSKPYNYYDGDIENRYIIEKGDLLISWSASIGVYIWNREKAVLNQHIFKVNVNNEIIDKYYFFYLVKTKLNEMVTRVHGSTMKHITKSTFDKIKISIPSLETQKHIVSILEKAEKLKEKRKITNEDTNKIIQSVFYEMFGDPVKNEKGFPIEILNDICDVRDGTHDSPKYKSEGIPLVTSKNVKDGFIDFSSAKLISKEDYESINKRSAVHDGDIIMPMIGTIGNPLIIKKDGDFAIKNVALIKFTKTNVSNIFIQTLLSSKYFEHITTNSKRGGTQKFIALKDIRNIKIPLPPIKLQNQFAEIVQKIEL
ncbi:MAG: restriction endonuclease subunit S, partial [Candidatus Woesearchaeota archaeon]